MRWLAALVLTVASCAIVEAQTQRQPENQPKSPSAQDQAASNPGQAPQSPLRIELVPAQPSPQEAADARTEREEDRWAQRWMVYTGVVTVLILFFQLIYYGMQISRMSQIAAGQNKDMQAAITEATRSAAAMERVAGTLIESTAAVQETLLVSREMAETQRFVFEISNRAWLSISFERMRVGGDETGVVFTPCFKVFNRGNTPASGVEFLAAADILSYPHETDFGFPLPNAYPGSRIGEIGPSMSRDLRATVPRRVGAAEESFVREGEPTRIYMWGLITYTDAFRKERSLRFAYSFFAIDDADKTSWFCQEIGIHSESD